jgi:calpain-5
MTVNYQLTPLIRIPYDDFISEFTDLSICHLINTSFFSFRRTWHESAFLGQWTTPNQAGGCPNNSDTFLKNPQYYFDVPRDDFDVIVQLLQTDTRGLPSEGNSRTTNYKSIGFHVMKVEENRKYRLHRLKKKAATSDYVKARSVYFQGVLAKGRHVIVPTTFEQGVETEFMMRIFMDDNVNVRELTLDYPEPLWFCAPFCSPPDCVTCVTVEGASGLAMGEQRGFLRMCECVRIL